MMLNPAQTATVAKPMTANTFGRFSTFIQNELGIKMPDAKKTMLQSRLQKRLRSLGIDSYDAYFDYVFGNGGSTEEVQKLINVVTTNKTDFFREPKHFDYLVRKALSELVNSRPMGVRRKTGVWSAGCSTGEEPYTLAIFLSDFARHHPGFGFSILGTDISSNVLRKAMLGIYSKVDVAPVPMQMKKRYLLKGKDRNRDQVRIVPELRSLVKFRQLNFMAENFHMHERMDIIFCRNVLIYFSRANQERIVNKLCRQLNSGGYLFIGHSETLSGMNVPLVSAAATIYKKPK